jgi:hypothetical protein
MIKSTKQIFEEEADRLIADLIQEYDRLGLRASGNYARSLRKEVSNKVKIQKKRHKNS